VTRPSSDFSSLMKSDSAVGGEACGDRGGGGAQGRGATTSPIGDLMPAVAATPPSWGSGLAGVVGRSDLEVLGVELTWR
jgi:hypothetical protein